MLFTSRVFAVFALVVIPTFYAVPARLRPAFLLAASFAFYAWGDPWAVPLVTATIVWTWLCALRGWTAASLLGSLGALAWFKYWNFALTSVETVARLDLGALHTTPWLPIGISFYTFHCASYALDVRRGKLAAEPSLLYHALYVMFFPQLVAGPVERSWWLLPQFHAGSVLTRERVRDGVFLVLLGFVKKVVFADRLAELIEPRFHEPVKDGLVAWVGVLLFTTNIYLDFSAYSDIALGTARLLGFDIRPNFDLPFVVPSIPERWRRWHISMGSFFRDFVYIPLGGGREGFWKTQRNVMIVMFLSGLWHGASATFVVWGLLNGLSMVAHALLEPALAVPRRLADRHVVTRWAWFYLCCAVTMLLISAINIFFRSDTFEVARSYVVAMFGGLPRGALPGGYAAGLGCLALTVVAHEAERHANVRKRIVDEPLVWGYVSWSLLVLVLLFGTSGTRRFIYFQF